MSGSASPIEVDHRGSSVAGRPIPRSRSGVSRKGMVERGRQPRILLVTSFEVPGDYDGTSMLPIKILRALRGRGIPAAIAHFRARSPWGRFRVDSFEGAPLFHVPVADWYGGLRKIHRHFAFDLVHAQHYGGATRSYPACCRDAVPMVYEIHSLLGDEVARDRLGRGPKFRAYMALERRVFQRAEAVIVLGRPVQQVVVEEKGVPEDRVHVIYPGIDLGEFDRPSNPLTIPGVEPSHRIIMYVGNVEHPNQGVSRLIDALPSVFAERPEARCVLVGGPGDVGRAYRERLGDWGDRLIVLEGRGPDQVVDLTRRADVLVHPRLACRENYSVQSKLAVYLAAGRPIVATDFGDYRDLLGRTAAGLLCDQSTEGLASSILRVLDDPTLAARLAGATRAVAREHFGMDRNVDRYLDVYRAVLSGHAQGS